MKARDGLQWIMKKTNFPEQSVHDPGQEMGQSMICVMYNCMYACQ